MPKIFYTEDEYESLKFENKELQAKVKHLDAMRPQWAQGHSSDSVAAQTKAAALQQVWGLVKVDNQTECLDRIQGLITRSRELARLMSPK